MFNRFPDVYHRVNAMLYMASHHPTNLFIASRRYTEIIFFKWPNKSIFLNKQKFSFLLKNSAPNQQTCVFHMPINRIIAELKKRNEFMRKFMRIFGQEGLLLPMINKQISQCIELTMISENFICF